MGYIGNAPYQGVLTGANIQDGTVDTADIANDAVTTTKIADTSVTAGKLHSTLDLSAKTVTLPDSSVTAAKLAPGAAVPSQTGNSGKFLTTDGTNASWGVVDVTNASNLTTGTLPIARIADGDITAAKLASGAASSNVGYPIAGRSSGYAGINSGVGWLRIGNMNARWAYRVSIMVTGGSLSPGVTSFVIHRGWGNDLYVGQVLKLNTQYATQVRANSTSSDGDWKLEVYWNTSTQQTCYVTIEPLGPNDISYSVDTSTGTVSSSLGYISGPYTF